MRPVTKVLIVGAGRGGRTLIELFQNDPTIAIIGVVDLRQHIAGIQLAKKLGIPTASDFQDFLDHPKPDLIIDVTGNPRVHDELSAKKAAESEIVGGLAARFMWALIDERKQQKIMAEKYQSMMEALGAEAESEFIVGNNRKMLEVAGLVMKVAPTASTVLIRGETGTGKEIIARAIHRHSPKREAPLVAINCTAFSQNLIESELFGHKKGAFTGAVADKKGLLAHADGGTVFLDEIGDMPLEMQTKLLRFLQTGEIRAIGDLVTKTVNVRVIAATNRNLETSIEEGRFRSDLFYRLNGFTIHLPPLRERSEDIPLFAYHFLKSAVADVNKKVTSISSEAMDFLMGYDWPGNLRELQGVISRAIILCSDHQIEKEHLPLSLQDETSAPKLDNGFLAAKTTVVENFERKAISKYLTDTRGNITQAAEKARLPRRTFYRLMDKLGISRDVYRKGSENHR